MRVLKVNIPGREYEIKIEKGILKNSGEIVRGLTKASRVAIVSDSNVAPLYADIVKTSLENHGFKTNLTVIPAGEKSKSSEMLNYLYDEFLDFGITRTDVVIALGGGVVGDLTGYAAATLLRGIDYVQIPTTLLAQVDSSVGGKVAIDLKRGKNLVGAFYQPKSVIIDTLCLKTLTPRVLSDGMAEVIKYGAIKSEKLFNLLESIKSTEELFANIDEIIYNCCDIKRMVVEGDEFDTGERMILNFGHTFGHAIEKQYNYETYTHGEGVGCGMIMACDFGEKLGITPVGIKARMEKIVKSYNLPHSIKISKDELNHAVLVDKKGDGDMINLILLDKIGHAVIKKIKKAEI